MNDHEKTLRWVSFWFLFSVILVAATIVLGIAYGNTLAREEQAQRYAIVQQQGGEPICAGPNGIYVRFPNIQPPAGKIS